MIRVLAVAPRIESYPALASDEELARIGDVPGVQLRTLTQVSRQRIIDRLTRERFDVLLWIGHGGPGWLAIDENEQVDPQWLASQLANRVSVAIIATCESMTRPAAAHLTQSFADVLPSAGVDTVTMSAVVADRAALEYDVAMLQALASGSPLRQAHLVGVTAAAAKGASQAPQLTPRDGQWRKEKSNMDGGSAADYRLSNAETVLRTVDGKMDRMSEQMNEHSTRLRVLEERVQTLATEVHRMSDQFNTMRSPVGYSRTWLAGSALAMTVVIVLLLFMTWRML